MMISTQSLSLPEIDSLKRLCQSLATLDAIICRDWEGRYYSYNKAWDEEKRESFFQMRNGSGDEFQILFSPHGAIVNGMAHESEMCCWLDTKVGNKIITEQHIWKGVVDSVPDEFHEFMFEEPVKSTGTTFCIWRKTHDIKWNIGNIKFPEDNYGDGSADLLYILDNNPATYQEWANEYYEEKFEEQPLSLDMVKYIYDFKPVTMAFVLALNPQFDDFENLKNDLEEIGYAVGW